MVRVGFQAIKGIFYEILKQESKLFKLCLLNFMIKRLAEKIIFNARPNFL